MTCLQTSHCLFSTEGPPVPVEGEDEVEFLPHLDYLGQPQLVVAPVEVGGKIRARCRQGGHLLGRQSGAPVLSLIAEVRPVLVDSRLESKNYFFLKTSSSNLE